jgi:hypothetical protein
MTILKNGAATVIFRPVSVSSASGYSVPSSTQAQARMKTMLLTTNSDSRDNSEWIDSSASWWRPRIRKIPNDTPSTSVMKARI